MATLHIGLQHQWTICQATHNDIQIWVYEEESPPLEAQSIKMSLSEHWSQLNGSVVPISAYFWTF